MAKRTVNSEFFQEWSSKMAYILGLIVADGSVIKRKNRKDSYVMNITSKDRSYLEKIRKAMSARCKLGLKRSGHIREKKYSYLQISNKKICKDLIQKGIYPRKTYHLDPIKVPDKYFPDFVRGFFDGDGTVYIYKVNGSPQIKASFKSASLPFISDLNQHLCRRLKIPQKTIHQTAPGKGKKIPAYYIDFYVDDCQKLAKFMYKTDSDLCLLRKRKIFEQWKLIKRRPYIKQNYPSKIKRQSNKNPVFQNTKSKKYSLLVQTI